MSNLRNKVQLIGNVGNDPEMTVLESGKKVIRFSLATNENYRNAKDRREMLWPEDLREIEMHGINSQGCTITK